MTEDEAATHSKDRSGTPVMTDSLSSQRVFKKSAPNNKLTLYLSSRDLSVSENQIDRLQGVLLVDPEYLDNKKVYGQVTLTFRYGREDEEVMGLKFCNEAVMCLAQLYPLHERAVPEPPTPLQEALVKRLGPNAHPFTMTVTPLAPPSVQLVPAKEYNGAPIGTSYDIRAYVADRPDEKLHRRSTVRMGIRVLQRASQSTMTGLTILKSEDNRTNDPQVSSIISSGMELAPPHVTVDKPFLLSDGKVKLEASLDKAVYFHGEPVTVHVSIRNNSSKTVRRIKVFVVQHVDVCMFSNGKFKNVVALINSKAECPLQPWTSLQRKYTLQPAKGATKNWIALEDSFSKSGASLASTVTCPSNSPDDRNVFAIYVSYYVKVKILVGAMGGELSLKLPFVLIHSAKEQEAEVKVQTPEKTPQEKETVDSTAEKHDVTVQSDVNIEQHEEQTPKTTKNEINKLTNKIKSRKNLIENEDEIIKCEEDVGT